MKKILALLFFISMVVLSTAGMAAADVNKYDYNFNWVVKEMDEGLPQACWFCPIYREIFFLINNLGYYASDTLQQWFMILLWIGLFGFIVFYVGKHFASLKEMDPSDFYRGLAVGIGKGILAAALLGNIEAIYYWVLNPAMDISLNLSHTLIMQSAPDNAGAQVLVHTTYSDTNGKKQTASCDNISTLVEASNIVKKNGHGGLTDEVLKHVSSDGKGLLFNNDTYKQVMCFMSTVGLSLSSGLALGLSAVNYAIDSTWYEHFRELLIGALIVWAYAYLMILFGLKLVDPLMRMAILATLMPLWIVLWVFPVTRGYTKAAWDCFINVVGTFIMLSVVMVIIIHVMSYALGSPSEVSAIFIKLSKGLVGEKTFDALSWKQGLWCLGYTMVCSKLLGSVEGLVKTFAAGAPDVGAASALESLGLKIAGLGATLGKTAAHGAVSVGKGAFAGGRLGIHKMSGGDNASAAPSRDVHESAASTGSRHFDESGSSGTESAGGTSPGGSPASPTGPASPAGGAAVAGVEAATTAATGAAPAPGTPSAPSTAASSASASTSAPAAASAADSDASVISPSASSSASASSSSPTRNAEHDEMDEAMFVRRMNAGKVDQATQDRINNVLRNTSGDERSRKFREMAADEERALRKEEASREREALAREGKLEETRIRDADERHQDIVDAAKWREREERRKAAEATEKAASEERKKRSEKENKEKMSVAT